MNLSIIIVNYNTSYFIKRTINSIICSNINCSYEIIVVDNNSHDDSCDQIKTNYRNVKLIANDTNDGFAKAVNQGVSHSKGNNILLLNPDTILKIDTVDKLIESMQKNDKVGIVGAKIINAEGDFQLSSRRKYPDILTSIFQITGLSYLFPKSRFFGRYNYTYISDNLSHEVDSVSGACMIFTRKLFDRLNGFDEDYFLFFEETDFCLRAQSCGYKIIYNAEAITIHYRGESMKTAPFNVKDVFFRSMLTFYKKNSKSMMSSYFIRPIVFFCYKLKDLTHHLRSKSNSYLQIILDNSTIIASYLLVLPLWYKFYYSIDISTALLLKHLPLLVCYMIAWNYISYFTGFYKSETPISRNTILTNILTFLLCSSTVYFINTIAFSRAIIILLFFFQFLTSFFWRYIYLYIKKYEILSVKIDENIFFKRVAFIGFSDKSQNLTTKILDSKTIYKNIIGYFDFTKADSKLPFLGDFNHFNDSIYKNAIDELIVYEKDLNKYNVFDLLSEVNKKITLKIQPEKENILLSKGEIEYIDDISLIKMDLPFYEKKYIILKRIFDIIFSFIGLIFSLPIHFYYSFKSKEYATINLSNDEKINVLHYSSSLEVVKKLPYLWYILIGKLSVVGSEISSSDTYDNSFNVKPGITGMYRLNSDMFLSANKNKYDYYYIENYSISLDIEIIIKTFGV